MSHIKFIILFLAVALLPINPLLAAEQERKVAVLPFSFHNATDDTGDVDVGAEVAKVISMKISKMPGWAPVDQSDVSAILQREDAADLSGAQIGKMLGADAIIIGTVQTFQFDLPPDVSGAAADAANTAGNVASSYTPYAGYAGTVVGLLNSLSASSAPRGHAKVVIDAHVIDVYGGKEISTLGSTASSSKSATNLWGSGGPNSDFLSKSFANCVAGQATFAAIKDMCNQLVGIEPKIDALAVNHVQGLVTDIDDDLICVNVGKMGGFKVGDKFIVERDTSSSRVGTIVLTDVSDQTSLAKLVDAPKLVLAGDTIRGEGDNASKESIGTVNKSVEQ